MDTLSNLRFEIWANERNSFVSIRADRPDNAEGLRYVWFCMDEKDLEVFSADSYRATIQDGTHSMDLCGDRVTFYDFEIHAALKLSGNFSVPYVVTEMPVHFRQYLARVVKLTWKRLRENLTEKNRYDSPRVELSFTPKQLARFLKLYGQGKGQVEFKVEDSIKARFEQDKLNPDFRQKFERLDAIARNSTHAYFETACVKLYRDGAKSYYWIAETNHGHRIMNGGLINHGEETAPDWSIHT